MANAYVERAANGGYTAVYQQPDGSYWKTTFQDQASAERALNAHMASLQWTTNQGPYQYPSQPAPPARPTGSYNTAPAAPANTGGGYNQQTMNLIAAQEQARLKQEQDRLAYERALALMNATGQVPASMGGGGTTLASQQQTWNQQQAALMQQNWLRQQGLTEQQAKIAQDQWNQTFSNNKEQQAIAQANILRQFGFTEQQAAVTQQNWEKTFGENQRQYNTSLLASKSGPRDWVTYNNLQSGGRMSTGDLAGAFSRQPAFGPMVADPNNSWEAALSQYVQNGNTNTNRGIGGSGTGQGEVGTGGESRGTGSSVISPGAPNAGSQYAFTQPTSISQADFSHWSPSQLQMQMGLWAAQGVDPEDALSQMRKSFISSAPVASGTHYRAA